MTERPPEGPESSPLSMAVAAAVRAALSEAGLEGDALADAVADALDGLDVLGGLDAGDVTVQVLRPGGPPPPAPDGPDMHVVDGGLSRDEPRPAGPRPPLHIAGEQTADEAAAEPPADPPVGLVAEGHIRLDAEERQAVFRGAVVRPYRIACDLGRLAVSVDGVVVEALGPGQSVDVEGGAISVRAADDGARGRYARL